MGLRFVYPKRLEGNLWAFRACLVIFVVFELQLESQKELERETRLVAFLEQRIEYSLRNLMNSLRITFLALVNQI